jgi:hypothetical protein
MDTGNGKEKDCSTRYRDGKETVGGRKSALIGM